MSDPRTEIAIIVNNVSDCPGLISEHGFSMYIRSGDLRIIFDTGQENSIFENNVRKLGIDMQSVNALVLSHGHYDHTGGVPAVLSACGELDVYAHPDIQNTRYSVRTERIKSNGIPLDSYAAIHNLPENRLHFSESYTMLSDIVGITGYIPRINSFEDTGGPFYFDKDGEEPDPINDDQALWIKTAEGIVVCAGCSHAGIINTLRYVQKISGCEKIHAVIGGLHLVNAKKERIDKTLEALDTFGLDLIVPCHCTGATATEILREHFKERFLAGAAGARFSFVM
ncbi:MAG: MBL fold metallo-hydrolase [Kiritimatiellia bacterium]